MQDQQLSVLLSVEGTKIVGLITESDLLRAAHTYWSNQGLFKKWVNESEAVMANPLVQKLMKTLADIGL